MRIQRWQLQLALLLLVLTIALYALRWYLFPGTMLHSEMWRFLVGDVAFLFLQVLLVTVFIDGVMQKREKDELRQKLNMIIGAFFSQAGTEILAQVAATDRNLEDVRDDLVVGHAWTPKDYENARRTFASHDASVDLDACDLAQLKAILTREKGYLLGLIGNQALLEHEHFTDLLWAVTHVAEELAARDDLSALERPDKAHIAGDVKRAYLLLGQAWLDYLCHLQTAYPYLFSLAVRTNPLDPQAHATVTE